MKQKMTMIAWGMFLCSLTSMGQTLSGRVLDNEKAALAYVTVTAQNQADTTQIHGGISDEAGKYQIKLPKGKYILSFRFVGYKNQERYLQPIITQYFIDNKSEIWLLFLIAHSKR